MKHNDYQPESQSTYEAFVIHSHAEIVGLLKEVYQQQAPIALFYRRNQALFSSEILRLDAQHDDIIIDCSAEPDIQTALIGGDRLVFVTFVHAIKLQFTIESIQEKIIEDGKPALKCHMPTQMMRLQRRNHFRVQTPKDAPLTCFMPIADHPDRGIHVEIFDMSLGGIAVMQTNDVLRLATGMVFPRCRVMIPEIGELITDIEIRHVPAANADGVRSIGCKFVNVPANMVNVLQRYIIQVERAKRSLT